MLEQSAAPATGLSIESTEYAPPSIETPAAPAAPSRGGRARRVDNARAAHDGWTFVLIPPGTGATPWTMRISVRRLRVVLGSLVALATGTVSIGILLAVLLTMAPAVEEETAGVRLGILTFDSSAAPGLDLAPAATAVAAATPSVGPAVPTPSTSDARGSASSPAASPAPVRATRPTIASSRTERARARTSRAAASRSSRAADVDQGVLASLPVLGRITSRWSKARRHPVLGVVRRHQGVDIAAPTGTQITAPAAGTVSYVGTRVGFGRTVEIDHGNGVVTRYAHCRTLLVERGESVTPGQLIATVGSTGLAKGPHLHYEVLVRGKSVDPLRTSLASLLPRRPSGDAASTALAGEPVAPVTPPIQDSPAGQDAPPPSEDKQSKDGASAAPAPQASLKLQR